MVKQLDTKRYAILSQISNTKQKMDKLQGTPNYRAWKDLKRHYDKLINQLRNYDKQMGYANG